GSMSFRRFIDFAIACGVMPRSLTRHPILEPINSLRDEVIATAKSWDSHPPLSATRVLSAQAYTIDSIKIHLNSNSALPMSPLTIHDAKAAVETAENIVKQSRQKDPDENVTTTSSRRHMTNLTQLALLS